MFDARGIRTLRALRVLCGLCEKRTPTGHAENAELSQRTQRRLRKANKPLSSFMPSEPYQSECMKENETSKTIIDAAMEVHRTLGPGLLESVYEEALAYELMQRGLRVARQVAFPVRFKGVHLDCGFRADLIIEDMIMVEIKSVEAFAPVHFKQLLTYLRLSNKPLGLIINFNVALLKDGIKRIVNNL